MKTDLMLNSTALSRLSCDRAYQVQCLWGYELQASAAAGFGSDFHTFAQYLETPETNFDLLKYFTETHPSQDRTLIKLCHYYSQVNPFKGTPPLALEYKFSFPYLETDDYRIILCGTIDRIDIEDNCVRIIDRKTARETKTNDVLNRYELHLQIPFYQWVWKKFLAAAFPEHQSKPVIGRYHGVFLSFDPVKFELGKVIELTEDMARDIENIITAAAARMISLHRLGDVLAPPTGMANQVCKNCQLASLCITRSHPNIYNFLSGLTPKPYDPRSWR